MYKIKNVAGAALWGGIGSLAAIAIVNLVTYVRGRIK